MTNAGPCALVVRRGLAGGLAIAQLLMTALLLLLSLLQVSAQPKRSSSDLEKVRAEIARARKNLEVLQARTQTTAEQLETIELQLSIQQAELELALDAQKSLESEQKEVETQVALLQQRIIIEKAHLTNRLVALYKMGALSYLRLLVSLDTRENPFEAAAALTYLVNRDSRAVSRFQASGKNLDMRLETLAEKRRGLERVTRLVANRQNSMAATRTEKERRLEALQSEGTKAAQRIARLEERARRLENLLGLLYEQPDMAPTGTRIENYRGALQWPLAGKVVEGFGRQRNLKFSTVTVSNGLKIEAAPGTEVRAIFQGTVLYAQWFKGYGNLVIIDHGNRIFSLYGNLQLPRVSVGDKVASQQTVATAGGDEEGSSGSLYFEIRENNKPQDPRTWLR